MWTFCGKQQLINLERCDLIKIRVTGNERVQIVAVSPDNAYIIAECATLTEADEKLTQLFNRLNGAKRG